MGTCIRCGRSRWLLHVNRHRLCDHCAPLVSADIEAGVRVILESRDIGYRSKKIDTKLSRLQLAIRLCRELFRWEDAGISILTAPLRDVVASFEAEMSSAIRRYVYEVRFSAQLKAADAATLSGKLAGYSKAIEKLFRLMDEVEDVTQIEEAILSLREERNERSADIKVDMAEAEVRKGNLKKAITLYIEIIDYLSTVDLFGPSRGIRYRSARSRLERLQADQKKLR